MARASGGQKKLKKGEAGAAKNYITRTQAIKKLQCSISDFRRLCILKGIFPRQPKSHKKANKGSTAPASFYYVKDISYLLHEPVLHKLREHKAFAKKLSRAIGREEWSTAKSLEENTKPKYRLDHIIKERYPSFPDALRDLDDALSLIILFAYLPSSEKISPSIIANCGKLAAEWQLYVMRTHSLRKVFLSVKGIYFQASVKGETVTWLVPYMFTQNIPSDVDFRIMLTFLELYQTLLGFVFFKLYIDINLVYPPKLDRKSDDDAAGIGALMLEETSRTLAIEGKKSTENGLATEKKVTSKDVKKQIRNLALHGTDAPEMEADVAGNTVAIDPMTTSLADTGEAADFPKPLDGTDDSAMQPEEDATHLFEDCYFYLSREVTRPTLEFVIRSFGGQVGWDAILGAGSPFTVNDPRITYHVIDRPVPTPSSSSAGTQANSSQAVIVFDHPGKRAYIQPQWVIDCVNQRKLLPTGLYAPGKILPPHLSPFVDSKAVKEQGGYIPVETGRSSISEGNLGEGNESEGDTDTDTDISEEEQEETTKLEGTGEEATPAINAIQPGPALLAAALNPDDASLLHAAELEAEARGIPYSSFQTSLSIQAKKSSKATDKASKATSISGQTTQEQNPASILLSNKQRKLFNKMKFGENRRKEEADKLSQKKRAIEKREKRRKKA